MLAQLGTSSASLGHSLADETGKHDDTVNNPKQGETLFRASVDNNQSSVLLELNLIDTRVMELIRPEQSGDATSR